MFHNLAAGSKTVRITVDGTNWEAAAGTGTITSGDIDTNGFDAVCIYTVLGTLTATATVSQTFNSAPDNETWLPMKYGAGAPGQTAGTTITATATAAGSNTKQIIQVDIYRPTARYVQVVTVMAVANVVIDAMFAVLYRADYNQTAVDATVATQLIINHPSN